MAFSLACAVAFSCAALASLAFSLAAAASVLPSGLAAEYPAEVADASVE